MELEKNFNPQLAEEKWNKHWAENGYFKSVPNELPAYTVVIPPPNVTGILHMGHTLNETVQDILVRRARMTGFNACWVPGSDHASIATEAKVVQMLKEKGIDKNNLSREEFLQYAFEWKEKYGNIIYDQIRKLGCSVDWDRVCFTMDEHYYEAVIKTFVTLYEKGLIYRGARMINWDVAAKTALSDEEVEFKEVTGKLYHIRYKIDGTENEYITIATQRPETIMGDTAVCFHPNDERYRHLEGRFVIVPLIHKKVPVIFDTYVDPAFGTGCLKVTPAHDINDYNLGLKHHLEIVDTLNNDGTLSEAAGIFIGTERFKARKMVIEKLTEEGLLVKEEIYSTRMGYSQRTGVVVEPKISTQWFLKMTELAKPALDAVLSGKIKIHPGDRFLATYKHWLENVKDWCISRQLWWGQQIPAWYDEQGNMVVAETETGARAKLKNQDAKISRDADVLDTWFSSWLWPMEVFHGITKHGNAEFNYYYPTATLVTGQDIIFFWVARMVMAGLEFKKEIPFKDVYFTGMVRDKQGRKMSKQLGNSPDLLQLIEQYGADAVRFGILISSPAGNDLLFDESSLEQGRFFNNKMWNALKLLKMWEANQTETGPDETAVFAIDWFGSRLAQAQQEADRLLKDFRLNEALKLIYSLIWDDFCSWYLEWVKPVYGEPIAAAVYAKTVSAYESLLELLHPFMPFITEEIYQLLQPGEMREALCVKQIMVAVNAEPAILAKGELLKKTITGIRDIRNKQQLKPKETIQVFISESAKNNYVSFENILAKQVHAAAIGYTKEEIGNSISMVNGKDKIFIVSEFFKQHDTLQKEDLEKDLSHLKGFLTSVEKKLNNEKFVANARPDVLAGEQKKKADAMEKIKMIEETLGIGK
jgi:valyl-tRNA synthetase